MKPATHIIYLLLEPACVQPACVMRPILPHEADFFLCGGAESAGPQITALLDPFEGCQPGFVNMDLSEIKQK